MYQESKVRREKKINFTLLELLIVISVIAILFALMLPALNSAREKAKSAQCLNNLKQCGTMAASYADSFNGNFSIQMPKSSWSRSLYEGLAVTGAPVYFSCPVRGKKFAWTTGEHGHKTVYGSFGINGDPKFANFANSGKTPFLRDVDASSVYFVMLRFHKAKMPSSSPLLFDSFGPIQQFTSPMVYYNRDDNAYATLRHQDQINSVYIDGHAASRKMHSFASDCYAAYLNFMTYNSGMYFRSRDLKTLLEVKH